jgi:heme/copper-type cytochrome/quinol oxidase subunit 2
MLSFGDPYWAFAWVCFYVVIFGIVGAGIYAILTRHWASRGKLRDGPGTHPRQISRRTALWLVLPVWLVVSLWIYQTRLAGKYHTLERVESGTEVVWQLTYYHPHRLFSTARVVRVPQARIAQWTIGEDWAGTFPQPALVIHLHDGKIYRSMGMLRRKFREEYVPRLRIWGVEVQGLL